MRPVSNACPGERGEAPDEEVNAHLGNPGYMEQAMPDLGACQPIQDQIDELEDEVETLLDVLDQVPPKDRPAIRQRIRQDQDRIQVLNQELQQCLLHPPSNLSIAGIERTQATQYFLFNGQGSGFAPDNSVPLVANKILILRVYVD